MRWRAGSKIPSAAAAAAASVGMLKSGWEGNWRFDSTGKKKRGDGGGGGRRTGDGGGGHSPISRPVWLLAPQGKPSVGADTTARVLYIKSTNDKAQKCRVY